MSDIFFDYDFSLWQTIIRAIKEDRKNYRDDMLKLLGEDLGRLKMRFDDYELRQHDIYADAMFLAYLAYFSGDAYLTMDAVLRTKIATRVKRREIEMAEPAPPKLTAETP